MKQDSKLIRIKLDRIDRNIIQALQKNARIQNNDLATVIGLSPLRVYDESNCLKKLVLFSITLLS